MSAIWALLSSLSFSSANIVIKKSLSDLSIPRTLMMSTLSGLCVLLVYILVGQVEINISNQFILLGLVFAAAEVTIYWSLFKAFAEGNVSVATGIITIYPILSTIISIVLFGQSTTWWVVVFIIIMICGAILVSVDWRDLQKNGLGKEDIAKGLGWMLLAMLLHAVYFPSLYEFTSAYEWQSVLLIIKIFSSLIIFLVFFVIRRESIIPPTKYIPQTSLLGLFEILGWAGYTFAATNADNSIVITALTSVSALFTAMLAFLILKEKLATLQYLGIVLITVGIIGISV
jgi:drug/metabolite transporter (DMT)-like permease